VIPGAGPGVPGNSNFGDLVRTIVDPYESGPSSEVSRFVLIGPEIRCGERTTFYMGLLLHELATNAAKYGALAGDEGIVSIEWNVVEDRFSVTWTESGGPDIEAEPLHGGFGSALIKDVIVNRMNGKFITEWPSSGLYVAMMLPMESLSE
jgi:two-component sensor histidine kinase